MAGVARQLEGIEAPGERPRAAMAGVAREKGGKAGRKPGSVLRRHPRAATEGDHLSGTAVTDGLERHMEIGTGKSANRCPWALLPAGVYRAGTSRCRWCALTAPLHPCLIPAPRKRGRGHRRCVSVALSSRSPALGVTQQAWPLGSPDFPQPDPPRQPQGRLGAPIAITSPAFPANLGGPSGAAALWSTDMARCAAIPGPLAPSAHSGWCRRGRSPGAVAQPDRATVS
jgi:hypothetical protein